MTTQATKSSSSSSSSLIAHPRPALRQGVRLQRLRHLRMEAEKATNPVEALDAITLVW